MILEFIKAEFRKEVTPGSFQLVARGYVPDVPEFDYTKHDYRVKDLLMTCELVDDVLIFTQHLPKIIS